MQMHEVRPIATEVAWSVCVCWSPPREPGGCAVWGMDSGGPKQERLQDFG